MIESVISPHIQLNNCSTENCTHGYFFRRFANRGFIFLNGINNGNPEL